MRNVRGLRRIYIIGATCVSQCCAVMNLIQNTNVITREWVQSDIYNIVDKLFTRFYWGREWLGGVHYLALLVCALISKHGHL